uniref:PKD domain-containing protein n=1 Tax=uncultured Erythrobacter sp. TaxID=263913 RepID=UPI002609BE19|nr:PKD domain-containing protein [uncultured Erythrobacter sp.]
MSRNSKGIGLRKTLMLGAALGAISTQAGAVSVNSIQITSAQALNGGCRIGYSYSVTGNINDGTTDFFKFGLTNSTGGVINSPNSLTQVPVGNTETFSGTYDVPSITPGATDNFFTIFESTTGTNITGNVSSQVLPKSLLQAAGGGCLTFIGNTAPTADAGSDSNIAGSSNISLSGSGADSDGDPLTFAWTQLSGPSVSISNANSATASFTSPAAINQTQVLSFQVDVSDGIAAPVSDTVTLTIQAIPNTPPVADAGTDFTGVAEASNTLDGTGSSDIDNDPLTFNWQQTSGTPVGLNNQDQATASFQGPPRSNTAQTFVFQLLVFDNMGGSSSDTVTVTIPANQAPIADAGADQNIAPSAQFTLDGSGSSDPDGDGLTYSWVQSSGPSVALTGASTATPSFTAPAVAASPQVLVFDLVVNDGLLSSPVDSISLTVPTNAPPTVDAGSDQNVTEGSSVSLSGSATDPESDPLTFSWTQTAGPAVTLSNPTSLAPSFAAPAKAALPQTLTFQLTANDGNSSVSDTVSVVVAGNIAPVADAGQDAQAAGSSSVTLDGTGSSDADGDTLTYSWSQISGTSVTLSSTTASQPTFTAPAKGSTDQTLVFALIVNDGISDSIADRVSITIPANGTPVADAGPDVSVGGGSSVTLDGSGSSDLDGDPLTYSWVQSAGPVVALSNATAQQPSFTAPVATSTVQSLTFDLVVSDGVQQSTVDQVTISVQANNAPVADAGSAQSVSGEAAVTLDGTGSNDADGDSLTYTWTQTGGPSVTLSGTNSAQPSFTAPATTFSAQTLEFTLEVSDGSASDTATVEVIVAANLAPVAAISGPGGDQRGGSTITLDGSGSTDPEGEALFYIWTQTSGPSVTINNASSAQASFVAPAATGSVQTLEFQLVVVDPLDASDAETFAVTIGANQPPVADAGPPQGPINGGDTVTLDGSASSDPDGDALTYSWVQTSGTPVTLTDASAAQPTFVAPNTNETLTFRLTVNDGQESSSAAVEIAVQAVGSITLIQRISGADAQVGFTSNLTGLNTTLATTNGVAQISLQSVPAGTYSVTAQDISAQGYAITDITCDDADSSANIAARTATIELSSGEDVTCTFSTTNSREAAVQAIYTFLTGRNALILANQPDLQRRLDRLSGVGSMESGSVNAYGLTVPGSEHLPIRVSIGNDQARFRTSLGMAVEGSNDQVFDIWAEAYFSRATIGSQEADFNIFHLGADVKLADSLLVGAILQRDEFSDRGALEQGEAEGEGWMAGPYITARLAPQFYAEARAAWGSSENRVSSLTDLVDTFDTNRSLYSGSLFGELELGKKTLLRPELTLRYLQEKQEAYIDSLGITIPQQTVDQGDLSFRPRLSHLVEMESGWSLRPFAEVEGIYTFGTAPDTSIASLLPANVADIFGEFRGRVEGGVDLFSSGNFRASASAFYDGIGADNFSNRGIHLGVSFGF